MQTPCVHNPAAHKVHLCAVNSCTTFMASLVGDVIVAAEGPRTWYKLTHLLAVFLGVLLHDCVPAAVYTFTAVCL